MAEGDGEETGIISVPPTVDGVVRPGTGVVRPGTGVVRPGSGNASTTEPPAVARAVVPDAPEKPLAPIHVVLPVIPVMPAKQGFLDKLVAGKPKKTESEIAEEEARKAEEEARKAAEEERKAQEKADEKARRDQEKADDRARKAAEDERKAAEDERKAERKAQEKAQEKADEKARRDQQKARRAEAKAREKAAREDEDDDDYDDYDDDEPDSPPPPARGLSAPPMAPPRPPARPAPPPPAPAPGRGGAPVRPAPPGRPGPSGPPPGPFRPGIPVGARPQRQPERRMAREEYEERPRRLPLSKRWLALGGAAALAVAIGGGAIVGANQPTTPPQWLAGVNVAAEAPALAGLNAGAPRPSAGGIAAVVTPLLTDGGLGGHLTASIVDVATGDSLFNLDDTAPATPASTAKLLTAAAVLATRGPTYQIATRAVAGDEPGEVVLIGGGDPTLAAGDPSTYAGAARLDKLAEQVKAALGTTAPTKVTYDTTLYEGSTSGPGWFDADLHSGFMAHVTALSTDGARINPRDTSQSAQRQWDPDVAAAQTFAQQLGLSPAAAVAGRAPANARPLGQVLSPPIGRLVEMMLLDSDNTIAEGLARQVALAKKMPASFAGAAAATKSALSDLGISSEGYGLADGSGLSNQNKVSAAQLTAVLSHAASPKYPQLRSIVSGLPVAGYSGTLAGRYGNPNVGGSGAGTVRAKTGTLTGVNALAGIAVDADGRLLAFAMVADANSNSQRALTQLDRTAAAIATCGCS